MSENAAPSSWSEWLARVGEPRRFLPGYPPVRDTRLRASLSLTAPPPRDAAASLAALALLLQRHGCGQPALVPALLAGAAFDVYLLEDTASVRELLAAARAELARGAPRAAPAESMAELAGLFGARGFPLGLAYGNPAGSAGLEAFPLLLHVDAAGGELRLEFDAARYPEALARELLQGYARALEACAGPGERALAEALPDEPSAAAFGAPRRVDRPPRPLHELVARQAERTPAATALVLGSRRVSYRDLEEQSTRLACHLRSLGAASGDIVAVHLTRSPELVVALLAVMKAGAAYMPIDASYPPRYVDAMLTSSAARLMCTDSESLGRVGHFAGELLVLDLELDTLPAGDPAQLPAVGGDELAYAIYTSGSTGTPKGVAMEHTGVVNTVLWRLEAYAFSAGDVSLQLPSCAFDSSVLDIFCPLAAGATLVLVRDDERLNVPRLRELMAGERVSRFIVTPSFYRLLLQDLGEERRHLRSVTVAGEACPRELVQQHHRLLPEVPLWNEYGPTENAVCSTAAVLAAGAPTVSIGRPVDNVSITLLDGAGRAVPVGAVGEVYLGGAGVARGYVANPEQTRARFLPDPHPDAPPDSRAFRTGDLAAWRHDGSLDFFGRLDSQVKIRGFRIEIDQVERALAACAGVAAGAVVCKEPEDGARYLAAYFVPSAGGAPAEQIERVRAELGWRLPSSMIPDVVRPLADLPLTVNGKIDRGALRELADEEPSAAGTGEALEDRILAICNEVIRGATLRAADNLFESGANSLEVLEITQRLRAALATDVAIREVYAHPSARLLSEHVGLRGASST